MATTDQEKEVVRPRVMELIPPANTTVRYPSTPDASLPPRPHIEIHRSGIFG